MTETENHMLKDGKSIMNTQSEKPKFFGTKTDLKKISKNPLTDESVGSVHKSHK